MNPNNKATEAEQYLRNGTARNRSIDSEEKLRANRRRFVLGGASLAITALAGCVGDDGLGIGGGDDDDTDDDSSDGEEDDDADDADDTAGTDGTDGADGTEDADGTDDDTTEESFMDRYGAQASEYDGPLAYQGDFERSSVSGRRVDGNTYVKIEEHGEATEIYSIGDTDYLVTPDGCFSGDFYDEPFVALPFDPTTLGLDFIANHHEDSTRVGTDTIDDDSVIVYELFVGLPGTNILTVHVHEDTGLFRRMELEGVWVVEYWYEGIEPVTEPSGDC